VNILKKYAILLSLLFVIACGDKPERVIVHQPIQPVQTTVSVTLPPEEPVVTGVDSLPALVSAYLPLVANGQELQYKLNTHGAHNLDINGDGYTDVVRVKEIIQTGVFSNSRLFVIQSRISLLPVVWQDVLTIDMSNTSGRYGIQITGNPLFYGPNFYIIPSYSMPYHRMRFVTWSYMPSRPAFSLAVRRQTRSTYRVVPRDRFMQQTRTVRTVTTTRKTTSSVKRSEYKPTNAESVTQRVTKQRNDYQAKKSTHEKDLNQRQKGFTRQDPNKKVGTGLAESDYKRNEQKALPPKSTSNPNTPTRAGPDTTQRQKSFERQDPNKKVGGGKATPSNTPSSTAPTRTTAPSRTTPPRRASPPPRKQKPSQAHTT
jgi:hypothetical protein